MKITWHKDAWYEYVDWKSEDKKTVKRINLLVKDIERNKFEGLGKPEPLKGELTGLWSRRIDSKNRLVYRVTDDAVEIVQCKTHYGDK